MGQIAIAFPCAPGFKTFLPIGLNVPIIVLLKRGKLDEEILPIIWSHEHQPETPSNMRPETVGHARPGPLPLGYWGFYIRRVFGLLSRAPNLIECLFCDVHIVNDVGILDDIDTDDKLVFPNMRRLIFGERGTRPGRRGDTILKYVSFPVSTSQIYIDDNLLAFLERSSSTLLELSFHHDLSFILYLPNAFASPPI
ncbi:hypothetical protein B0H14DRAFT_3908582 [Mycena olivaceomarginata]|nr:hypothetical protein B0H14DRAFT_3908582 [Mycena olivaceomarginata]